MTPQPTSAAQKLTPIDIGNANSRMAIIGKFRKDDSVTACTFRSHAEGKGVHKLDVSTLFDVVRPELRFVVDRKSTIKVGDVFFQGYRLLVPSLKTTSATNSMPILATSPLLEPSRSRSLEGTSVEKWERIQRTGEQLFEDLTWHLDCLSRFAHGNFTKLLTWMVASRPAVRANEELQQPSAGGANLIHIAKFQQRLAEDLAMRSDALTTLLCLEDDLPAVRQRVAGRMAAWKDNSPFADDPEVRSQQIGLVVAELVNMRGQLAQEDEELMTFFAANKAKWANSLAEDPELDFAAPTLDRNGHPLNKRVAVLYSAYRKSSDWVQRFVRTSAMHSYLFCWLASKYEEHTEANYTKAAETMFDVGMARQDDQRFIVEGRDARKANLERLESVAKAVRTEFEGVLAKRREAGDIAAGLGAVEDLRRHLGIVESRLARLFMPKHAYTRKELLERCETLWVSCCQLAGGPVHKIHQENEVLAAEIFNLYRFILSYRDDEKQDNIDTQKFMRFLQGKAESKSSSGAIGRVFGKLDKVTSVNAVKGAFVEELAHTVFTHFGKEFNAKLAEIAAERERLRQLYRTRHEKTLKADKAVPGLAWRVVTWAGIQEPTARTVKRESKLAQLAATSSAKDIVRTVRAPAPILDEIKQRDLADQWKGELRIEGQKVGTVTGGKTSEEVMITTDPDAATESLQKKMGWEIVLHPETEKAGEPSSELVIDLMERWPDLPQTVRGSDGPAREVLEKYDELTEKENALHRKFVSADADEDFNRLNRARLLGEAMLAAPEEQVQLGAQDLSNVFGVIMAMVENLGTPKAVWLNNRPIREGNTGWSELKKINLSEFYPLPDEEKDNVSTILQYHYALCNNLEDRAIQDYLIELQDLRALVVAAGHTNIELQIYNCTMDAYCAMAEKIGPGKLLFVENAPLVLYLTRQAVASAASLEKFGELIAVTVDDPNVAGVQIPILVSPASIANAKVGMPLISPDTLKLPLFLDSASATAMSSMGQTLLGTAYAANQSLIVESATMRSPWLLLATGLSQRHGFSKIDTSVSIEKKKAITAMDIPLPVGDETILAYMSRLWRSKPQLTHAIFLTKWINLARVWQRGGTNKEFQKNDNFTDWMLDWVGTRAQQQKAHGRDGMAAYKAAFLGLPVDVQRPPKIEVTPSGANNWQDLFGPTAAPLPGTRFRMDKIEMDSSWVEFL